LSSFKPGSKIAVSVCCVRESLKDVIVQVTRVHKCYDILATKVLEGRDVQTTTMFVCELRIPDANYIIRRSIVYYPGEIIIILFTVLGCRKCCDNS
jgi:hypothetical protein